MIELQPLLSLPSHSSAPSRTSLPHVCVVSVGVTVGVSVGVAVTVSVAVAGGRQLPALASFTTNLLPSPVPVNDMQYLSVPTVTSTLTVAAPFGTEKPPMPAGLPTLSRPALSFAVFGTPDESLYLYRLSEPFAFQFAHGMLKVTLLVPSSSFTEPPRPLPSGAQRGSAELPFAPGTTSASLERSTIFGLLLRSNFFPVTPWSAALTAVDTISCACVGANHAIAPTSAATPVRMNSFFIEFSSFPECSLPLLPRGSRPFCFSSEYGANATSSRRRA